MKFNLMKLKRKQIREKEFYSNGKNYLNKLNNKLRKMALKDGISLVKL